MNTTIKKILAVTAIAGFGLTAFGHALTLADYPAPFVTSAVFDGKIVIGEKASVVDVLGATDIAAALQREASVPTTGDGVVVSGGVTEDIAIGSTLDDAFGTLDNNDIPALIDSSIDFADDTYDVKETIAFGLSMVTGSYDPTNGEDEMGANPYVVFPSEDLAYTYAFTDPINVSLVGDTTDDQDTLKITFLGKDMEITTAASGTMTVKVANNYYMLFGDKVTVGGKSITLKGVSDDSAVVDVDGVTKVIAKDDTENVNGIKVKVTSIFNDDGTAQDFAELEIGDKITDTVTEGDDFELFTTYDNVEAPYSWNVGINTTYVNELGIYNKNGITNIDAEDDYLDPITVGEKLALPNNFATIELVETTTSKPITYTITTLETAINNADTNTISIVASEDGAITIDGEDVDRIWISNATSFWYTNSDGVKTDASVDSATLVNDNTVYTVTLNATSDQLKITEASETIYLNMTTSASAVGTYFGTSEDQDTGELFYGTTDISGKDYDVLTEYGSVIKMPSDNLDADKVIITLFEDQTEATVAVTSQGTVASATDGVSLNPIAVGMAIMDKDATLGSKAYIVVGGPCANTVAAALMGNPADCAAGFAEGKAKIKLFADKNALLVAGYSGLDTQGASRVLANYADYTFTGTELEVVTANLNSLSVNSIQ